MGKVTPIIERIYKNCESIAVLDNVIRSARAKRDRLKRENEALEHYNAQGHWRGKAVSKLDWRNRSRFSVIRQTNTNTAA